MTARAGRMHLFLILVLLSTVAAQAEEMAIPLDAKGLPLWVVKEWHDSPVRLELDDRQALDRLLAQVPIASFEREQIRPVFSTPKSFTLVLETRVTEDEARALTAAGYAFERLPDLEKAGRQATEARWAAEAAAGKALAAAGSLTYPTHAEIGAQLAQLEADYPDICRSFIWGQSVEGRDLQGIVISFDVDNTTAEPEVRLSSTMHGDETVGIVMLLKLAHYLAENYEQPGFDQVTDLVNTTEITILPLHNPDGYVAGQRVNANGVDLNRNFAEPAGTHPVLETENIHFSNLGFSNHYVISQNTHGGALVCNYLWDYTYALAPDNDACIQLALAYSTTNLPMYNGSFPQGITNGADWYVATGTLQDWSYEMTGCIDLTVEISNTKWPAEATLDGFWEDNRQSLLNYIACANYGVQGVVTGSDTMLPLDATVTVVGNSKAVTTDPAHGDYYKMLDTGTYDFHFSAPGYISQTVTAVSTIWGTTTVLDVVLDPAAQGEVAGTVTGQGGSGLDAQVSFYSLPLGDFVTTVPASAATGGSYFANLAYGNYRMEAAAPGHVTGVDTVTVSSTPSAVNFSLVQAEEVVLFTDDFESGLGQWTGAWGLTDPADGHDSANSMNDSPGSNYANNDNTIMEMTAGADLTDAVSGEVSFWARWEIEDAYDGGYFEVSTDGGGSWTPVATQYTGSNSGQGTQTPVGAPVFDGTQAGWVFNSADLGPWLTETDLRFRFRMASDTSLHFSGFFVDDFEVMIEREKEPSPVPGSPALVAAVEAWPNPFNPSTEVNFTVPRAGPVNLAVFDVQGRLVKTLVRGQYTQGEHAERWDGTAESGARVSSGTYFVLMTAGSHQAVSKMSLVK